MYKQDKDLGTMRHLLAILCTKINFCFFLYSNINKFRLSKTADRKEESEVAEAMHKLADDITPLYARVAPQSFANMTGKALSESF